MYYGLGGSALRFCCLLNLVSLVFLHFTKQSQCHRAWNCFRSQRLWVDAKPYPYLISFQNDAIIIEYAGEDNMRAGIE